MKVKADTWPVMSFVMGMMDVLLDIVDIFDGSGSILPLNLDLHHNLRIPQPLYPLLQKSSDNFHPHTSGTNLLSFHSIIQISFASARDDCSRDKHVWK